MCNSSCPRQACCKQASNNNQAVLTQAVRLGIAIALATGLRLSEVADLRPGTMPPSRKRRPRRPPMSPPEQ